MPPDLKHSLCTTGLDEAILGFSESVDPEADSTRIAELLRHGAHAMMQAPEQLQQSEAFLKENIDQVRHQGCASRVRQR